MGRSSRWLTGLMIAGVATAAACGDDTGSGGAGGSGGDDKTTSTTTSGPTTTGPTTTSTTTTTTTTTTTNTTGMGGMADGGGGSGQGGMAEGGGGSAQGGGGAGQGGSGQGGSGQGGGAMGSGETCGDAIVIGEGTFVGTYNGFANDYDPTGSGCTGYAEVGVDIAYQVTIPAGEELQAVLLPAEADGSLYLVTDCAMLSSCLEGADAGGAGDAEAIIYMNNGATPVTASLIVDSYSTTGVGAYTLQVNLGDETNCTDFFDNDVDGSIDCAEAATCQGTAACAPGAGATGAVCAANTACSATGGDPACLMPAVGFPGGYCSEWCDLAADDCSGDAICIDVGANEGLCFDGCTIDSDCRTGYFCDVDACFPLPTECAAPSVAMLGANSGTTVGAPNEIDATCTSSFAGSGSEKIYTFTPATSGTMTLTLVSPSDFTVSLRTPGCGSEADETQCVDNAGSGGTETLTETVTAGTTYYIVVQSYSEGNDDTFTLTVAVN